MKKWMFVIFPGILLLAFLFFYSQDMTAEAQREHLHAVQAAEQKAAEADRQKMIEDKARQDAEKRTADQAAEEAKNEAENAAKKQAESDRIQKETDADQANVDKYTKQGDDLQAEYDSLVKQESAEKRAAFDLLKTVERARINRQDAQLEIDRMVDMIAQRAERSSLTHSYGSPGAPRSE